MTTAQLPMSTADNPLVELDALRAEVARLRPIAAAAEYAHGPAGCVEEGGDCDEDKPAGVEWCSHVAVRYASYAHVTAHQQLANLIGEVRHELGGLPGAEGVLDLIRDRLYGIVVDLENNVGDTADEVTEHQVYVTAVEEKIEADVWEKENDRG